MRRAHLVALAMVAVAACDGSGPGGDAAVVDGASGDGGEGGVAAPVIPWLDGSAPLVELGPCPTGWRTVTDLDPVECAPYPAGGRESCADGEAHFPGEEGCRPIGEACPAGDYSAALPATGTIVYVRAGAAAGGDGSMAAPHAALSEVPWASLSAGTTVALARGSYPGVLPLKAGVRVMGACAAQTVVTGVDAPVRSVISVTSAGAAAEVSGLTIRGTIQEGAHVEGGRSLHLEGVLIDQVTMMGISVAEAGSRVTLEEVVVKDPRVSAAGFFGVAIAAADGARVEGTRVVITGAAEAALFVDDADTVVTLSDSAIVDAEGLPDGTRGRAVVVRFGARFEARRTLVANVQDTAIIVGLDGAEAVLEDVIVREVRTTRSGFSGRGIEIQDSARLTATRVVVAEHADVGIIASDPETELTLRHVVVRDGRGQGDGSFGRGIGLTNGPRLDAANLAVLRNLEAGIQLAEGGASAILRDTLIADTGAEASSSTFGRGLAVQLGAHLDAGRVVVRGNHEIGVFVAGDETDILLEDVVISDTRPRPLDGRGGLGLIVQGGAEATGSRVRIAGTYEHGAMVIAARMLLSDVSIEDVHRAECATTTCTEQGFGYGAAAVDATLDLTAFSIARAELCGVFMASNLEPLDVDLANGMVTGARIGACIQSEGYDLTRLTNEVEFSENESNLDTTRLPVPEPSAASASL